MVFILTSKQCYMLTTVYEVKIGTFYKSRNFLMQHAWVVLHIACHVQFSMTSSVTLVTPYITIVFNFMKICVQSR